MNDRSRHVETDVHVYRLRLAAVADGSVVFGWDYPGSTLLHVRILRASTAEPAPESDPAPEPDPDPEAAPDGPWRVVYDGDTGSFRDRDTALGSGTLPGNRLRYAVFARDGDGPWVLWRDEVVTLP